MPEQPVVLLTQPMHADGVALLAPHVRLITAPDTKPDTLRKWAAEADGIIVRLLRPISLYQTRRPRTRAS